MRENPEILIYGYGNPGRMDDGLGPVFVELVEKWIGKQHISNISTDSNYQLNIEDACSIRDYDIVIFVDASLENVSHFKLETLLPSDKVNFTMHAVSPSFVLNLCRELYGQSPEAYVLHIKAYEFEFREILTERANVNLKKAFDFLTGILENPQELLPLCIPAVAGVTG